MHLSEDLQVFFFLPVNVFWVQPRWCKTSQELRIAALRVVGCQGVKVFLLKICHYNYFCHYCHLYYYHNLSLSCHNLIILVLHDLSFWVWLQFDLSSVVNTNKSEELESEGIKNKQDIKVLEEVIAELTKDKPQLQKAQTEPEDNNTNPGHEDTK